MNFVSLDDLPKKIPIFPLTGAVLFPKTQLPLNIFEPRYVQMLNAALATPHKLIGMIQPISGDDKSLKKVGCVGRVTSYNETDDHRYLITLNGIIRFEIENELDTTTQYRQLEVNYENFITDLKSEDVTNVDRESLLKLIKKYLKNKSLLADWDIIQQTPTEQLINYSGVLVPFTPEEKQLLLEARTIMGRSRALEALYQSYTIEETADTSTQLH
ncbi:MAG: LON peptidase substrate-binding domain-containing protein [Pelagibacterales bacterium]|jgi:Lon protease-like protein|nr:LON peptidase substrate-binding domain-containing protein [Pelagibacterales bacterium]